MEPADFNNLKTNLSTNKDESSPIISSIQGPDGKIESISIGLTTRNNNQSVISRTLNIPINDSWNIVDTDQDLDMIHYNYKNADLSKYGNLRGVVVDTTRGIKVADSYGYTPTAVADAIIPNYDNKLHLTDQTGLTYQIDLDSPGVSIKYGIEGVLIRVFKWNGKVYYSSHRRFDISRSRWGDSLPFLTIYKMLGGPDGEDLFSKQEKFSPNVHFFLAEHPGLLHVTKNHIGSGFLYYLGHRVMWSIDPSISPFRTTDENGHPRLSPGETIQNWNQDPRENIGFVSSDIILPKIRPTIPSFQESEESARLGAPPDIISLPNLEIGEANTLLRYGYYRQYDDRVIDHRLRTGEFIVIYKPDGSLLRVESSAYRWRANTTDDNPNRRHRFYQLTDAAIRLDPTKSEDDLGRFRRLFPPMMRWKIDDIKERLASAPILIWDQRDNQLDPVHLEEISTVDDRIYNIWACLLMASPLNRQAEVSTFYREYFEDRSQVIDWIAELKKDDYPSGIEEPEPELVNIINSTSNLTSQEIGEKNYAKQLTYDQVFKLTLTRQLARKPGRILYRLIVMMKKDRRNKLEKPSE